MNFDIMHTNKIFNAEIEKLKNKENYVKNVINNIEKSILELKNMEKNKINKGHDKVAWCSKNGGNKEFGRNKHRNSLQKEKIGYRNENVRK